MKEMNIQVLDEYFTAERARHLEELCEFLRIPSVSSLSVHHDDMARAAEWIARQLRAAGVPTVDVISTVGHPVVYGSWPARDPQAPTILIYAHYDTQPPDPLDAWITPPFDPTIRDGRLYARGASDDKGNLFIPLKVVEAFHATVGRPPVGLVFLFEGEEEIGSPNLRAVLQKQKDRFHADVVLSADSAMWGQDTPSLVLGSKGMVGLQLDVRGARSDLHSGLHGGLAPNPLNALASLLASMWTPAGQVTVAGFYNGVHTLTESERAEIATVPFNEVSYRQSLGIEALVGEPGYGPLERNWARPTLDVNGLWGGFQGEGVKAVIASEAHAKITCRLVPNQDPAQVIAALQQHVRMHCPPGVTVTMHAIIGSSPAYTIASDHPALLVARDALRASYGRDPLMIRLGGTLPVTEFFQTDFGVDTVCLAWEMPDENLHSPNEFLRLENFDRGLRVYADLLSRLAHQSEREEQI